MPQLTPEQKANIARQVGGVPVEEKRRIAASLGASAVQPQNDSAPAALAPEPTPTNAGPMSWGEAGKHYATGGIPGLLYGAATAEPSVMSDLMMERLKGIPEAITGIPGAIRGLATSMEPFRKVLMSGMMRGPLAEPKEAVEAIPGLAKGAAEGIAAPVGATVRGGAALLAPEKFNAPTDEEFRQEARAQGSLIGDAALGVVGAPLLRKTSKYMREAPVRKGYTTLNPETLKPELPATAVKAETGVPLPKVDPGAIVEFSEPVNLASKALGADASLEAGDTLRRVFNEAFPDLKQAQQQNRFLRGAMDSPQKFRAAVQWSRNRVWREGIEPAFKAAGDVDLSPVADQLISEIPESIRVQRPERAAALAETYRSLFDGKTVHAASLHEFAKEARARIQSKLAKNAFDRQAAFGTPDGKLAESFNTALRDRLYQHVQQKTGVDIRPTAQRYGALSELEQTALGLSEPQSFLEKLFTSYTFPTPRAVAARVGSQIGQHMISNMKLLEKAFDRYKLEPQKVTQPFKRLISDIVGKQQDLLPIGRLGEGPLLEPPPGTSRAIGEDIFKIQQRVAREARNKPPDDLVGKQVGFGEGSTGRWTGKPAKPGEFFPGKTGLVEEGPEGAKTVRDYRNQEQLFSIRQGSVIDELVQVLNKSGKIGTRGANILAQIPPELIQKINLPKPKLDKLIQTLIDQGRIGTRGADRLSPTPPPSQ